MKKRYLYEIIFSRLVLVIFLIVAFAILGFAKYSVGPGVLDNQLKVALPSGKIIVVEVADTVEKRIKGLSNREELARDSAMLFIFDNESYHSFWMPDMHFAIDIVWLDGNYKIVNVVEDVQPASDKSLGNVPRYINQIPAKYVLEFNSGFCEEYDLTNGDYIKLMS